MKADISELIKKVHESIEGRYDLSPGDLHEIHAALCELQDPRDRGLDDSWVHDVDMGCKG